MLRIPVYSMRMHTKPAELLYEVKPAAMHVDREQGGFEMKSQPIRLQLDNEAFFEALGIKDTASQLREAAQAGQQAVTRYMSRLAERKNAVSGPDGITIAEFAARLPARPQSKLVFIPDQKPAISWEGGSLDMRYTPDDVDIAWERGEVLLRYMPYQVEISIEKWYK